MLLILQIFSLFLAILLRMAKNSPFSERLNDSGTLSHTLPKALPLESGREQAAEQPVPSVSFADISPHCGESPPQVISQYTVNKTEETAR